MNETLDFALRTVLIGVGATLVMDAWQWMLRRSGVRTLDFALVGRWVGHLARGTWSHPAIAQAAPIAGERVIGWATHYAIGLGFAGLLLKTFGLGWARSPSLLPALLVGLATVAAPLLVMQPAMGFGVASSKTPRPLFNALKSVATHAVFGLGLYAAARMTAGWLPA